jgi:hypothetical protein
MHMLRVSHAWAARTKACDSSQHLYRSFPRPPPRRSLKGLSFCSKGVISKLINRASKSSRCNYPNPIFSSRLNGRKSNTALRKLLVLRHQTDNRAFSLHFRIRLQKGQSSREENVTSYRQLVQIGIKLTRLGTEVVLRKTQKITCLLLHFIINCPGNIACRPQLLVIGEANTGFRLPLPQITSRSPCQSLQKPRGLGTRSGLDLQLGVKWQEPFCRQIPLLGKMWNPQLSGAKNGKQSLIGTNCECMEPWGQQPFTIVILTFPSGIQNVNVIQVVSFFLLTTPLQHDHIDACPFL